MLFSQAVVHLILNLVTIRPKIRTLILVGSKFCFFPEKEHEFIFFFTAALYANYFHFINTCNACNVIISHTLPAIWELAVSRWKQQVTEQQEAY